jgi:tellurite resistance protein TerC
VVWIGFVALVLVLLALDLGVFHRRARVVSVREALGWSAVWIACGLSFSVFVYHAYEGRWLGLGTHPDVVDQSAALPEGRHLDGRTAAVRYLTGYVVEKSLSVDNVFVIAMVFSLLGIPRLYQHRVLYWGILGALVMRGAMIAVGTTLISSFSWVLYVFGALLLVTAVKMLFLGDEDEPRDTWIVRLTRRLFPVTERLHGEHFVVRAGSSASLEAPMPGSAAEEDVAVARARPGALMLTPLALALVAVETTDVIFAVDSIPAIFAITADPFLVFTSNVFAILGLRSLYFALAGAIAAFRYLKVSLAFVLALVGAKMLAHGHVETLLGPDANAYLLLAILGILATGVLASLLRRPPA